eukprot:Phypoly_transcript_10581.p1 GENE.Phypoly_transcript_10581~~Phypoly_transcript_10581.p1  ORF type:complete len:305 (+),score=45.55 Phypoly_transcript_10581:195-1109(+)
MVEESHNINSLSFSAWATPPHLLMDCVVQMLSEFNILQEYEIKKETVKELLRSIQSAYNQNPFHSWMHAVSVTQMMFLLISKSSLTTVLDTREKYSLLIAALCHDLDHPGLSNGFQINSKSPLACKYNNVSVLENHHFAVTMKILQPKEDAIFPEQDLPSLYNLIRSLILGTDMANHFPLVTDFEKYVDCYQWDNPLHRHQFLVLLMKAADISNEARPFTVSKVWADALMKEYFAQSSLEKARQLPVTPFMDPDKVKIPQTQVNFIDSFILPTFRLLHKVVPDFQPFVDNILENRRLWSETAAS